MQMRQGTTGRPLLTPLRGYAHGELPEVTLAPAIDVLGYDRRLIVAGSGAGRSRQATEDQATCLTFALFGRTRYFVEVTVKVRSMFLRACVSSGAAKVDATP